MFLRYIVDTNAWIDYLNAKLDKSRDYKSIIELEEVLLPTIIISEIKKIYCQTYPDDKFEGDFKKLKSLENIEILNDITEKVAIEAGRLRCQLGPIIGNIITNINLQKRKGKKHNRHISLCDCILLSIAIIKNAKILSKDIDFIILADPVNYNVPEKFHYLKNYIFAINQRKGNRSA